MQQEILKIKQHVFNDYSTDVLYTLCYGSKVYGTRENLSDIDLIVVVNDKNLREKEEYIVKGTKFDCEIVGIDSFTSSLNSGSVKFVEAAMHSEKWESFKKYVNLPQIEKSFIEKSQKSWNKALSNLLTDNWKVVLLNTYHSIRILTFLAQVQEKAIIYDFEIAKEVKQKLFQIETIEEFNFFVLPWREELLSVVNKQSVNQFSQVR